MSLAAYTENLSLGSLTSRAHKALPMRLLLQPLGVESRHIQIPKNAHEIESHSPRQIVKRKMQDFSALASETLSWMAQEARICPEAAAVLDVLALLMPDESRDFCEADVILKKIHTNDPIASASKFFTETGKRKSPSGFHTFGYVASAHVAPIDKRGDVLLERGKSIWDEPLWIGLSHGLVETLSSENNIRSLIETGLLPPDTFMASSIVATRVEKLMRAVGTISTLKPNDGISMVAEYAGRHWRVDSVSDQSQLRELYLLTDAVTANATPGLAIQMAKTIRNFALAN